MEGVELALKNSVRKEKTLTGGDDFSVDDLLDFSNDDVFVDDEAELKVQRKKGASVSFNDGDNTLGRSNITGEEFKSFPTSELSVPMDDLVELEWLSNFVDDSFTPYSAPTSKPVWLTGNRRHPVGPVNEYSCFKTPHPVKSRSKRPRTGLSVWSIGSPSLNDSSSSSTTSSSSSWLSGAEIFGEPAVKSKKKNKRKPSLSSEVFSSRGQTQTQTRRCSHCGVQKTPQWRAGPNGAKTLCNACGVRFKSGRLLPEYRPACSPTFSSELHSNHHRKVIEMRRKKDTTNADETDLIPPVQVLQSV